MTFVFIINLWSVVLIGWHTQQGQTFPLWLPYWLNIKVNRQLVTLESALHVVKYLASTKTLGISVVIFTFSDPVVCLINV